mgnify:CR=1 FL=1
MNSQPPHQLGAEAHGEQPEHERRRDVGRGGEDPTGLEEQAGLEGERREGREAAEHSGDEEGAQPQRPPLDGDVSADVAIVGGAVVPLLTGIIADVTGSLAIAFTLPMLCYAIIAAFGIYARKPA